MDVEKTPYQGNKDLAAADAIWTIGKSAAEHAISHNEANGPVDKVEVKRIILFVNEREKAEEVAQYLVSKGIDAVSLSRDTPERRQSEILSTFTSTTSVTASLSEASLTSTKSKGYNFTPLHKLQGAPVRSMPNTKVLVTTDLGSRGIDTLAVRHVILYDVPHTSIDFIHRLGRTGRMGRRGRGIVLVGKNDRKDIVAEVREGMFKGQALI
jgi:ATP-dependent RNA helicase MRH4